MFSPFGITKAGKAPSTSPITGSGSMNFIPSIGTSFVAFVVAFLAYMFL